MQTTITKSNYKESVEFLNRANDAYYKDSEPIMSDAEFDSLLDQLQEFEDENPSLIAKNSPTQNVGSDNLGTFKKVKHDIPMLSISKVHNFEDLEKWVDDTEKKLGQKVEFWMEEKLDGSSLSICFDKTGKLNLAKTRGRGDFGDCVTENAKMIQGIPHQLRVLPFVDSDYEIRGEVVLKESDFLDVNEYVISKGEKAYSNPRNLASGSLKQKDPQEVKNRKLTFIAYSIVKGGKSDHSLDIDLLLALGFNVPKFKHIQRDMGIEDMKEFIEEIGSKRDENEYGLDGIVVKVNGKEHYNRLGGNSKSPNYLKAYKFPAKLAIGVLSAVSFQIGRSGVCTPLAHFNEPVEIDGVSISKCTLHNFDYINNLDLHINDEVIVSRNGDVIPGVKCIHKEAENRTPILPPENCPECHIGKVEQVNGEVVYKCMNPDCSAKILGKFKHFVSREGMDMLGLAEKTLEQIIELGLVSDFADLYDLTEEILMSKVPKIGKKKAENVVNSIQTSKNRGFDKFLTGLGIPGCSSGTCKDLVNHFKNIDNLKNATYGELLSVDGIGPTSAKNIFEWLVDGNNWNMINKLKERGIKMTKEETKSKSDKLEGKTFCVTGKLSQPREVFKEMIEANGGTVSSGVSKNLNYLICGEDSGSKLDKAEKLNVKIIDEAEFLEMIS